MKLLFFNIGGQEIALIWIVVLIIFFGIGNYGKNTALGYWGSVILAMLATPLIAFGVICYLRNKQTA